MGQLTGANLFVFIERLPDDREEGSVVRIQVIETAAGIILGSELNAEWRLHYSCP